MNKLVQQSGLVRNLSMKSHYNKISWTNSNPYNKRWQFKWKPSYYSYPRDYSQEHTHVKRPEDSWDAVPLGWAWFQDFAQRMLPGFQTAWDRRHRFFDTFNVYFIPAFSLTFYQLYDLNVGFKFLTVVPWFLLYVRCRDKHYDPDFKETYLRDMMWKNEQLTQYFNEETVHVLDYDCEYVKGYPDADKFPEYNNRLWRFFNTDTSMTEGYFKMGDVETGAVMNLKFKTMPVPGKFRYQVGEPFYFYDLRAEITHQGQFKEVVLVDEAESLKKMRPFLFLI